MFADCISAVAEDIFIAGYSQASERQAREASTPSFGGEVPQSTPVFLDDQQIFHEASMSCAPKSQAFARCRDGDAVSSKEFHLSSAKQYSTPCAQSTPVFAGDQQISQEASMSCPQRPQAFAHSIDGDADAYIPDAIIVPGSSHFDFHIVMHEKPFFFGFRSNHLQAACPAEFLVVSCPYPNYNLL